jgi:hypothetical protein
MEPLNVGERLCDSFAREAVEGPYHDDIDLSARR